VPVDQPHTLTDTLRPLGGGPVDYLCIIGHKGAVVKIEDLN